MKSSLLLPLLLPLLFAPSQAPPSHCPPPHCPPPSLPLPITPLPIFLPHYCLHLPIAISPSSPPSFLSTLHSPPHSQSLPALLFLPISPYQSPLCHLPSPGSLPAPLSRHTTTIIEFLLIYSSIYSSIRPMEPSPHSSSGDFTSILQISAH